MTAQPRLASQPVEYLTIAEAAARYHVSSAYIRRRIIDGSLPAVRSGRRIIRIDSLNLEQLFRPIQTARTTLAKALPRRTRQSDQAQGSAI